MTDSDQPEPKRAERLRTRVRQLILMRETGPKRAAWHAARTQLIWRLHGEIERAEQRQRENDGAAEAPNDN